MDQTYLKAICMLKINLLWTRHKFKKEKKKKKSKTLWPFFMDGVQLPQG